MARMYKALYLSDTSLLLLLHVLLLFPFASSSSVSVKITRYSIGFVIVEVSMKNSTFAK